MLSIPKYIFLTIFFKDIIYSFVIPQTDSKDLKIDEHVIEIFRRSGREAPHSATYGRT